MPNVLNLLLLATAASMTSAQSPDCTIANGLLPAWTRACADLLFGTPFALANDPAYQQIVFNALAEICVTGPPVASCGACVDVLPALGEPCCQVSNPAECWARMQAQQTPTPSIVAAESSYLATHSVLPVSFPDISTSGTVIVPAVPTAGPTPQSASSPAAATSTANDGSGADTGASTQTTAMMTPTSDSNGGSSASATGNSAGHGTSYFDQWIMMIMPGLAAWIF